MSLRVVLAEDHRIVREGLKSLFSTGSGCAVVGETGDGLAVEGLVAELKPDILVLDLVLPGLNGIAVARRIHKHHPRTRMVVLSMHGDEPFVLEALSAGALGYVLKDTTATELIRAITEAASGRRYLSPPLPQHLVEVHQRRSRRSGSSDPYHTLTNREREVLQLVAEGLTSQSIAGRLGVSRRTVESHRASLIRKLGLPTTAALIRFAVERGLVGTPAPGLPTIPRKDDLT